ncbi:hypothetical protein CLOP_g17900 [Closterium sp. NIES-67]|nr:hypothetical protein CLOP_g17900 [Closterium sp. NIES-67]
MESAPLKNPVAFVLELESTCTPSTSSKRDKRHTMDKFCPMDPPCILDDPINPGHVMTDPSILIKKIDLMKPSDDAMTGILNSRIDMMSLLGPGRMAVDDVKPTYSETLCKALEKSSTSADDLDKSNDLPLLDVPLPSLSQSPMGEKLAMELVCKEKNLRLEALPSTSVSMKSFNELVVAPQLTLDCGGLRSLPVPLLQQDDLQGDGNVLSVGAFLSMSESVKANSTMASRARDFLYLDWHLSQDFKSCNSSKRSNAGGKLSFQKVPQLQSESLHPGSLFSLIQDTVHDAPARVVLGSEKRMELPSALVRMVDAVSTSPSVASLVPPAPSASQAAAAAQQPSQPHPQFSYAELQTSTQPEGPLSRAEFRPSPQPQPQSQHQSQPQSQPQPQPSPAIPPPVSPVDLPRSRIVPLPSAAAASAATSASVAAAAAAAGGGGATAAASAAASVMLKKHEHEEPMPGSATREEVKRIGFQRHVQKMSSELNFFMNARQGKASSLQQDPPQEVAVAIKPSRVAEDASFREGDAGRALEKEVQDVSAVQPIGVKSPPAAAAASQFSKEPVRHVHKVQMSQDLEDILDLAKGEYQKLLWSLNQEVRASVKPFRLKQEVSQSIKEEMSRQNSGQLVQERVLQQLKCLYLLHQSAMLCWQYGIRVAHLFLEQGLEAASIAHLAPLVKRSREALASAFELVEGGATVDHPKLSMLTSILRSHKKTCQSMDPKGSTNVLIVAENMAFFTMYKLLGTCQFQPFQLGRSGVLTGLDGKSVPEEKWTIVQQEVNEALEFSDCLLVSPRFLVPSFPISKFNVVIVYSDLVEDQNLSAIIYVNGKFHVLAVEDPDEPQQTKMKDMPIPSGNGLRPITAERALDVERRHEEPEPPAVIVLDSEPDDGCNDGNDFATEPQRHSAPTEMDAPTYTAAEAHEVAAEQNDWRQEGHLSHHHPVAMPEQKKAAVEYKRTVIVNTREQFGPIVLKRRHLYDKILQLEESGIQILERDLLAPAEIVLTASSCLIIYNHQRLTDVQKLAAMDGLPSSSLMNVCLEAVVETHLKALSFAYQSCFMVFEGTAAYLTQIKRNVDDLYAGGAALDLDVQCFFSSSEDSTESLILKLLSSASPSADGPSGSQPFRTPLPESETPQEAFLCRFPSLNPLSAHIIMTSGLPLPVFMCLHHEQQASATVPRGLRARSLSLFQAQCEHKTAQQGPAYIQLPVQGSRNSPPPEGNMPMHPSDMIQAGYDFRSAYSAMPGRHRGLPPVSDGVRYDSRHERNADPAAAAYSGTGFPSGRRSRSPPDAETLVLSDDDDDPGQRDGGWSTYRQQHDLQDRPQQQPQQRGVYDRSGAPGRLITAGAAMDGYAFYDEARGVQSFPSALEIEQADAASLLADEDYYRNHMSQARMSDLPNGHHLASPPSSTYFPGASDSEPSQAASAASGVKSALQGWMSRRQSAGQHNRTTGSSSFHSEAQPAGSRGNPYGSVSSPPQLPRYSGPGTRFDDGRIPSGYSPQQEQPSHSRYYQQQQQQHPLSSQRYQSHHQQLQHSPNQEKWASPQAPPQAYAQRRAREQNRNPNKRVCMGLFQDDTGRRQEEADASLQKFRHTESKIPRHVLLKRKLQGQQASDQARSFSSKAEESRLSWTPSDKRAREVLAYERAEGDGKQCKLVWKKPRPSLD